jgi:succinate dehydrogenase / fumarate reductase cytochrome b subunit
MAATGLFLCLFLVVHVSGNFQLFKNDYGMSFNTYSYFMTHNPLIKTISYLLYVTFIVHIIQSLLLTIKNRSARPQGYVQNAPAANSTFSSRNMGIMGSVLLIFLVIHFKDFWFQYKFGEVAYVNYTEVEYNNGKKDIFLSDVLDKNPVLMELIQQNPNFEKAERTNVKDLYSVVANTFADNMLLGVFYILSMFAVSFHLAHGFQSAWQSLGVNHKKYKPLIKALGWVFAFVLPVCFAAMPIYFMFK